MAKIHISDLANNPGNCLQDLAVQEQQILHGGLGIIPQSSVPKPEDICQLRPPGFFNPLM
jgi:hypothetical protein